MGLAVSLLLHGLLFFAGNALFIKPVEYAVESGAGGIDVTLAAPPPDEAPVPVVHAEPPPLPLPPPDEPVLETPPAVQPSPIVVAATNEIPATKVPADESVVESKSPVQDGPPPVTKTDIAPTPTATGALMHVTPRYRRNPAPVYPMTARRQGWEGVVVLEVVVDRNGKPESVDLKDSSGHAVLDESARKAVQTWRFMPAMMGSLPVSSMVLVPVRFELDKY